MNKMKKIRFSWLDVQESAVSCLKQIREKNIDVDAVVSLGRGGSIPSGYIAYQLKKKLEYINYSRKTGFVGSTLSQFDKQGCFLLVDDATETGKSFETVKSLFPSCKFITCVLFQSEGSSYEPDIIGIRYPSVTPILPWENKR